MNNCVGVVVAYIMNLARATARNCVVQVCNALYPSHRMDRSLATTTTTTTPLTIHDETFSGVIDGKLVTTRQQWVAAPAEATAFLMVQMNGNFCTHEPIISCSVCLGRECLGQPTFCNCFLCCKKRYLDEIHTLGPEWCTCDECIKTKRTRATMTTTA